MPIRTRRPWTTYEVTILETEYPVGGASKVHQAFSAAGIPLRTNSQLYDKAFKLGLHRNRRAGRTRPSKAPAVSATIPINRSPQEVFAEADVDSLLRMGGGLQTAMVEALHDLTGFIDRHGAVLAELRDRAANGAASVTEPRP